MLFNKPYLPPTCRGLSAASIITFLLILLSACQHTKPNINPPLIPEQTKSHSDGAPKGPAPTEFEKVLPSNQPLSHYGNPATYQVKGKKYDVLTSSEGYQTKGIASWYGTKFHKVRTSSGEVYDMYALTAAHKTLPLPTYVRVKNLENNREAIVKVNDRGPFHEDRVIDLSYAAASKLGLLPKGTASVEVTALSSAPKAQYYLQVGAFESQDKANALHDKLIKLSLDADVQIEQRDARYIVCLGPFLDKKQSKQSRQLLKKQGIPGVFSYLK
ncbi:MAG: septal ring lytic transglycosylase RlpA family protein [Legionella sp.]|nr:septal ring lytic transglycosylase RlpA family protein [Legionella sp.]